MANGLVYITARVIDDSQKKGCTYVKVLAEGMACSKWWDKRVKCNRIGA